MPLSQHHPNRITIALSQSPHEIPTNESVVSQLVENIRWSERVEGESGENNRARSGGEESLRELMVNMIRELSREMEMTQVQLAISIGQVELLSDMLSSQYSMAQAQIDRCLIRQRAIVLSSLAEDDLESKSKSNSNWLLEVPHWSTAHRIPTTTTSHDGQANHHLDLDNLREAMSDNRCLSFDSSNSNSNSNPFHLTEHDHEHDSDAAGLSLKSNLMSHSLRRSRIPNDSKATLVGFTRHGDLPTGTRLSRPSSEDPLTNFNDFGTKLGSSIHTNGQDPEPDSGSKSGRARIGPTLRTIRPTGPNSQAHPRSNLVRLARDIRSDSSSSASASASGSASASASASASGSGSGSAALLAGLFDSLTRRIRPASASSAPPPNSLDPHQLLSFSGPSPITHTLTHSIPHPPSRSTIEPARSIIVSSSLFTNRSLSLLLDSSSVSTQTTFNSDPSSPLIPTALPSSPFSLPSALLPTQPFPPSLNSPLLHQSLPSSNSSALSSPPNSLLLPSECLAVSSCACPSLQQMHPLIHHAPPPASDSPPSSPLQSSSNTTATLSTATNPTPLAAPPNPTSSCPSLTSVPDSSSSSSSHHKKPRTSSASLKSPIESFITTSKTLPTLATQADNLLVHPDRSQLHMSPTTRLSSRHPHRNSVSAERDAVTRLTRQCSVASRTTSIDSHRPPPSPHPSGSHLDSDDDLPVLSSSKGPPLTHPLGSDPPLISPTFSSSTIGLPPFLPPPNDLMTPSFMRSLSNPQSVSANSSGSYHSSPGPAQMKSQPQVKLTTTQPATTKAYLSTAKGTLGKALGLRTARSEQWLRGKGAEPNVTTVPTVAFGTLQSGSKPLSSATSGLPSSLILPSKTSSTSVTASTVIFSGSQAAHQHSSETSHKNGPGQTTSHTISQTSPPGYASQLSKANSVFLPPPSNTTMELSTFTNPQSNPPPFLVFGQEAAEQARIRVGEGGGEEQDGQPIVDRFGFIVDARYGVKVAREARDKQKRNRLKTTDEQPNDCAEQDAGSLKDPGAACVSDPGQRRQSGDGIQGDAQLLAPPLSSKPMQQRSKSSEFDQTPIMTTALPIKSQVDVEAELVSLREALGLPPAAATAEDASDSSIKKGKGAAADREEATPGLVPKQAETTTQSVKRLLAQLNEMHRLLEQNQMEAWTQFIAKRKLKLVKASGPATGVGATNGGGLIGKDGDGQKVHGGAGSVSAESVGAFLGTSQGASGTGLLASSAMGGGASGSGTGRATAGESGGGKQHRDVITCHDPNLIGIASMGVSNNHNSKALKEDWREFRALVAKGIPVALRPRIWLECSGASEVMEPGYYAELLEAHKGEEGLCLSQIECDVTRTLPTNVYFGGDGPGVDKLRRVLAAMSWHNPVVGYCQGMNMVAATLLLTIPSEEDAFWILVCIVDKILPSDYYTSHLLSSQADQRVLRDLVKEYLPEIWDHFENLEIELPAITFGWFLSLFADALPIQTLLRVFDLFLIDGSLLLFRISLGLLEFNQSKILSIDSPASLYAYMRGPMTLSSHEVDKLIEVAVGKFGCVKMRKITRLREDYLKVVKSEMGI